MQTKQAKDGALEKFPPDDCPSVGGVFFFQFRPLSFECSEKAASAKLATRNRTGTPFHGAGLGEMIPLLVPLAQLALSCPVSVPEHIAQEIRTFQENCPQAGVDPVSRGTSRTHAGAG